MATKGRTKTTQTPCGKFKKGSPKHKACMAKIVGKEGLLEAVGGAVGEAVGALGMAIPKGSKMTPAKLKSKNKKKNN